MWNFRANLSCEPSNPLIWQDTGVSKDPFRQIVGQRLRAVAAEFGYPTAGELAEFIGGQRAQVDTWYNGRALVGVPYASFLCERWGITLDWLYRGVPDGMNHGTYVRIMARMEGAEAPADVDTTEPGQASASGAVLVEGARRKKRSVSKAAAT